MKRKTRNHPPRRKSAIRDVKPLILIVCEGKKSEPQYLQTVIKNFGLNPQNVKIIKKTGSAPITVVNTAIDEAGTAIKTGNPYDAVYCVFDRDEHKSYLQACDKINAQKQDITRYVPIRSNPCFEYWQLLHFEDTAQPFAKSHKSAAQACKTSLKKALKQAGIDDEKTMLDQLCLQTDIAIKRSKRILQQAQANDAMNPSTEMHILIEALRDLAKQ